MKLRTLIVFFLLLFAMRSIAQDSIKNKGFEMKTLYKPDKKGLTRNAQRIRLSISDGILMAFNFDTVHPIFEF